MAIHRPLKCRALLLAPLFMLGACAVGPDFVAPKAPDDKTYLPEAGLTGTPQTLRFDEQRPLPSQWWLAFHAPNLDALEQAGLTQSPSLQQAREVLTEAKENLAAGYGIFYPSLNAGLGATREVLPLAERGNSAGSGSVFNLYTLSASVGYTLDFFGLERREVESLRATFDQQRALLGASYLSLTTNIANTAIAEAAYAEEVGDTTRLVALTGEQVALVKAQVQAGVAAGATLDAAEQAQAGAEASLPGLRQRQAAAEHLLDMLMGYTPAKAPAIALRMEQLAMPERLPGVVPSELVRKRPDIMAAEASLHSASANVGVATAAIYPSVSVNAGYGLSNTSFSKLGEAKSHFWSVGPSINIPEIQGAAPWHRKKAAEAEYRQALANYRQTVLTAFEQVADVLTAVQNDSQALDALQRAYAASQSQRDVALASEQAGLIDHNAALSADIQTLTAKVNLTQAKAQLYQDTVALYAALGGGWDPDRDPSKGNAQ